VLIRKQALWRVQNGRTNRFAVLWACWVVPRLVGACGAPVPIVSVRVFGIFAHSICQTVIAYGAACRVASSLDCRHIAGDMGFAIKRRLPPVQVEARGHAESIGIIGAGRYAVWPANIESQWERRSEVGNVRLRFARACEDLTPGALLLSLLVTLSWRAGLYRLRGLIYPHLQPFGPINTPRAQRRSCTSILAIQHCATWPALAPYKVG
jgi:hypothetical protein